MLLVACLATAPAQADSIPWTGGADDDWNTGSNWAGGVVPGDEDLAEFYGSGAGNLNMTLSSGSTVDGMFFNPEATAPVTISVTSGAHLALDGDAAIDISVLTGSHTIQGSGAGGGDLPEMRALGALQTWDVAAGATLTINARLGARAWPYGTSYRKSGAGTLELGGSNSGSGGWNFHQGGAFEVQDGTLRLTHPNASGDWHNSYTVHNGATLEVAGGIAHFDMRHGSLMLAGDGVDGIGALHLATGTSTNFPSGDRYMYLSADATIGVSSGTTFTISQKISGGSRLTKAGEGTLILSSDQNLYGSTIVAEGTLTLAPGGELRVALRDNGASERILGSATANLDGLLRLDASRVSDTEGTWSLVDVGSLNVSWGETFALAFIDDGPAFTKEGGGVFTSGDWTFRQATGTLTLGPEPEEEVRLTAERVGTELKLSWPASAEDHVLETTPTLGTPDWQAVAATPEIQDGLYIATVPMQGDSAFFRLRLP